MTRKVYRMCVTYYNQRERVAVARHLTTTARASVEWDDRLGVEDNHAAAAALVLGREPEFQAACDGGGFVFGVDPANDGT